MIDVSQVVPSNILTDDDIAKLMLNILEQHPDGINENTLIDMVTTIYAEYNTALYTIGAINLAIRGLINVSVDNDKNIVFGKMLNDIYYLNGFTLLAILAILIVMATIMINKNGLFPKLFIVAIVLTILKLCNIF